MTDETNQAEIHTVGIYDHKKRELRMQTQAFEGSDGVNDEMLANTRTNTSLPEDWKSLSLQSRRELMGGELPKDGGIVGEKMDSAQAKEVLAWMDEEHGKTTRKS